MEDRLPSKNSVNTSVGYGGVVVSVGAVRCCCDVGVYGV